MSIAITGANGRLGTLILEQLLRAVPAHQIVACVRNLDRMKRYEELGVDVRYCDYDRPESLEPAIAGASQLLLISGSHRDDTVRLRQHAHVVEAARNAKVRHLLYTSFAFAERGSIPMTHLHLATEQAILTAGIPYTFLRNGLYMDFVGTLDLNAAIANNELTIPPYEWKLNSVTRHDLALAIARVLTEPHHENRTYELTASTPWTFDELATALSELTGRPIRVVQDPRVQNWIYGFLKKIDSASTSPDLERLLGRPSTSLQESLKPFLVVG